ncbi:MAG: LemA family protein [Granulosicoccus sp.]|nr:LemA family protein [Granulosicoccus sp.]
MTQLTLPNRRFPSRLQATSLKLSILVILRCQSHQARINSWCLHSLLPICVESIVLFRASSTSLVETRTASAIIRCNTTENTSVSSKRFRIIGAMTILLIVSGCGINNIPTYDEAVNGRWSDVQNQYKRRADLVPNLVNTVEGFAEQERDVLTEVTEARTRVSQMNISPELLSDPEAFQQFQANQDSLTSALQRLMVVVEAYPDLKSNENFLALQQQLEGTENRISVARRDYIQAVQTYNTELRTIPGRWWRRFMYPDMLPKQNFTVSEEDTINPTVDFSN